MNFARILCIAMLVYIAWHTFEDSKTISKLEKQHFELQLKLEQLTTGIKAKIEADVQNYKLDSAFQHFHGNVWVPRDKFLLDKQSKASADKAYNLLQALEQFGKIDSTLIQSRISFIDIAVEPTEAPKQISFKK